MSGIYIQCNECKSTFDGDYPDHKGIYRFYGYRWGEQAMLADEARAKGWMVSSRLSWDSYDLCPECVRHSDANSIHDRSFGPRSTVSG